jgi:hypothetical protein
VQTIRDVTGDAFTVVFPSGSTEVWSCRSGGILRSTSASGTDPDGITVRMSSTQTNGVDFPRTVEAGQSWTAAVDWRVTATHPSGVSATGTATYRANYQAERQEAVVVGAGSFGDAVRVSRSSTLRMTLSVGAQSAQVTVTESGTLWLAPGVGMVRSGPNEVTASAGGSTQTATASSELVSHHVPP